MKTTTLVALLIALVIATPATSSSLWQHSNYWRSPSGQIACRYDPRGTAANTYDQLSCYRERDGYFVDVQTDGRKAGGMYIDPYNHSPASKNVGMLKALHIWVPTQAPILRYGESWWNGGNRTSLRCFSGRAGMTCKSYVGGYVHGFFISRYTHRVW
jgi:hypothetical protein